MKPTHTFASVKLIRFIGFLYLMVILCAGFSQGYVRGTLVVPDDAVATATNILNNNGLFQLGLTTDLIAFLLDAAIAVLLYSVFKPFNKHLALLAAAFRILAHPAIGSLNLLNHYMALNILDTPHTSTFSTVQLQEMSATLMEAHHYGYLIAGGFFGIHCCLLGILIFKSNVFPRWYGGFLIGAAAGYLLETFGNFNTSGYETYTALIVGISAAIGEVGLTAYMLLKGATQSYRNLKNLPL